MDQTESEKMIGVLIISPHTLLRECLCCLINKQSNLRLIGGSPSVPETDLNDSLQHAAVTLLHLDLKKQTNYMQITALANQIPSTKIIVMSEQHSTEEAFHVLKAGARGYLSISTSPEAFIKCIHVVAEGQIWAPFQATTRLMEEYSKLVQANRQVHKMVQSKLTEREYEILQLIAQGYSNRDMAARLFISEKTVKTHLSNIFSKIEVSDRLQAALYAIRHQLVKL